MKSLTLALLTSALILSACNRAQTDKPTDNASNAAAPLERSAAQDKYITINATHAFDTPAPIAKIAFTPNDVASWLGVVGMLSTEGHFYTSSIEGDVINLISEDKHTDIIGLDRPGAPGMFLAVMDDGALRAYVESDDQFGFRVAPMTDDVGLFIGVCRPASELTDDVYLITEKYELARYGMSWTPNSLTLSPLEIELTTPAVNYPKDCLINSAQKPALLIFEGTPSAKLDVIDDNLPAVSNPNLRDNRFNLDYLNGDSNDYFAYLREGRYFTRSYDKADANGGPTKVSRIVSTREMIGASFGLLNASNLKESYDFRIERGLSVDGLILARTIASTSSPFGGSGFNDGVVALADAEENRVVILSRSYLLGNIPDQ